MQPQRMSLLCAGYDPRINPDITNEFAAAAMRFGHSYITDTLPFVDQHFRRDRNTLLRDVSDVLAATRPKIVLCVYIISIMRLR